MTIASVLDTLPLHHACGIARECSTTHTICSAPVESFGPLFHEQHFPQSEGFSQTFRKSARSSHVMAERPAASAAWARQPSWLRPARFTHWCAGSDGQTRGRMGKPGIVWPGPSTAGRTGVAGRRLRAREQGLGSAVALGESRESPRGPAPYSRNRDQFANGQRPRLWRA